MTIVGVTNNYFDQYPHLKAELTAKYSTVRFPTDNVRLDGDVLINHLKGCEIAIIGLATFSERVHAALPDLKIISMCSAGVDHVDPVLLNKYGVKIWWAAGVNKNSVSELTLCYMIYALRRIGEFSGILRQGKWRGPIGVGSELRGRVVGIHGCGHIGKEVVRLLQPWGVKILISDRVPMPEFCSQHGIEQVEPEELWARSEVLSVHLARNQTTIGLYTDKVLDKLRPGCVIVNLARGGIFDEKALYDRLVSKQIAAAAFDVFAIEPANGNPLLELPNFFGSPHIGAATGAAWEAMLSSGLHGVEHAYHPTPGVYPFD